MRLIPFIILVILFRCLPGKLGTGAGKLRNVFFTPKELALQNSASQGKQGVINGKKEEHAESIVGLLSNAWPYLSLIYFTLVV